jgi:hypothetical protein
VIRGWSNAIRHSSRKTSGAPLPVSISSLARKNLRILLVTWRWKSSRSRSKDNPHFTEISRFRKWFALVCTCVKAVHQHENIHCGRKKDLRLFDSADDNKLRAFGITRSFIFLMSATRVWFILPRLSNNRNDST